MAPTHQGRIQIDDGTSSRLSRGRARLGAAYAWRYWRCVLVIAVVAAAAAWCGVSWYASSEESRVMAQAQAVGLDLSRPSHPQVVTRGDFWWASRCPETGGRFNGATLAAWLRDALADDPQALSTLTCFLEEKRPDTPRADVAAPVEGRVMLLSLEALRRTRNREIEGVRSVISMAAGEFCAAEIPNGDFAFVQRLMAGSFAVSAARFTVRIHCLPPDVIDGMVGAIGEIETHYALRQAVAVGLRARYRCLCEMQDHPEEAFGTIEAIIYRSMPGVAARDRTRLVSDSCQVYQACPAGTDMVFPWIDAIEPAYQASDFWALRGLGLAPTQSVLSAYLRFLRECRASRIALTCIRDRVVTAGAPFQSQSDVAAEDPVSGALFWVSANDNCVTVSAPAFGRWPAFSLEMSFARETDVGP